MDMLRSSELNLSRITNLARIVRMEVRSRGGATSEYPATHALL